MVYREYTRKLMEAIQEGVLDRDTVINAALSYLSEAEVKDMCEANGFFEDEEEEAEEEAESEEDLLNNPNYVGSRHHY
jgi:hypothetical protein